MLSIPLNKLPWLKSLLHSLQKGPRHGHQKSQHQKFQIMRLKATKKKVPTITVDPVKKGFCFGRILIKVSEFVRKILNWRWILAPKTVSARAISDLKTRQITRCSSCFSNLTKFDTKSKQVFRKILNWFLVQQPVAACAHQPT